MDLTDPTRAVTPTLDGPVLAVLARAGRPLTVGDVAAEAARGSEIGVRKSLGRLVEQGLVKATVVGRNRVHELNRAHVAAPAAITLGNLRIELWKRFRETLGGWPIRPVYACAFGSAARGQGSVDSDIDLLLVHQPFPDETVRSTKPSTVSDLLGETITTMAGGVGEVPPDPEIWGRQIDALRGSVQGWSGNVLQVIDLSADEWYDPRRRTRQLLDQVEQDKVELVSSVIRAPWMQ